MAATISLVVAAPGTAPAVASASSSLSGARTISASIAHPSREVFGFALASSLSNSSVGYPSWNFDLLTTVAYFGLHVNDKGTFVNDSYYTTWNSTALSGLVSVAHQHGTKVVVTVILQDFSPSTPNMCAGLAHADATVAATVAEVKAKGVDGVNIDYEGLNGSCGTSNTSWARQAMVGFVQKMRAGLGSTYYLSVDTYASSAIDAYGFFDVAGIAASANSLFVMAYDLEYSNYSWPPASCLRFCLGPTAPLTGYYYNDATVASQYVGKIGAGKVILGVPYYGRKACVGAAVANAYPTSSVVADGYLDAVGEATFYEVKPGSYTAHRDAHSAGGERWDTWYNTTLNCTRELYWDDAYSLGKKYDLVNSTGLRGVGIWTLNYGGGAPELWTALATHFVRCTAARITPAPTSPSVSGTQVIFTAASSGCANPEYAFWLRPATSATWKPLRAYSATPTLSWNASGTSGSFYIGVWVKGAGSATGTFDSNATINYVVSPASCRAVSLSSSPASPQPHSAGAPVTFMATASGCSNASPLYEFWILKGSTWQVVRAWSGTPTWTWADAGLAAGVYHFGVWVRDAASPGVHSSSLGRYDATAGMAFTLSASCTTVAESSSPSSATAHGKGTQVTFTATSTGCTSANPLYEFWILNGRVWQVVQGWSTRSTWVWNTAGVPAGTFHFGVWIRDAASPGCFDGGAMGRYDSYGGVAYTLT